MKIINLLLGNNSNFPESVKIPFADMRLVLDLSRSLLHQLIYLDGERALPERFLFCNLLKPGMHVVDVGSNIGYYLLFEQQKVGKGGFVTCIEPSPENLAELSANILENGWSNLYVHACAVGASNQEVGLKDGINSGVVALEEGVFRAAMHPLDALIGSRKCDLLKIDVDGYEYEVLKGARAILERDNPTVFLEYHPQLVAQHGGSFVEVMELLGEYYSDFQFFDVPDSVSVLKKLAVNYFDVDPVRSIEIAHLSESEMHKGRLYGTFWIICTTGEFQQPKPGER